MKSREICNFVQGFQSDRLASMDMRESVTEDAPPTTTNALF